MTEGHQHNERTGSPDSSVHGNSAPVQRVDNHDHGGKVLATIGLIISSVTLGGLLVFLFMSWWTSSLEQQLIDAKIEAGAAQANVTADAARVNARVAVDEVERMRTQLAGKGITIPKEH